MWRVARLAALDRYSYLCVRCSSNLDVEVNHTLPVRGRGYGDSCFHHLDRLETLCGECHKIETLRQREVWGT